MEKLEPFVNKLQKWVSLDQEQWDRIMLPLSEAVNNAILHGNQLQEDKSVAVVAELKDDILTISVQDEGDGFDPETIPDPLKEENLLKEGGRGVYLIRQYTDNLHFTENGTKITMDFKL
ncbi:serine/threonine-protein kinase RsbW [Fodinibius sediminis]|uniref:Serine/threonine-protein kinase RsbW n=2 Tax=Fodinibius sediminis TaxID=1214077 RepID=A0A521E126_9BACT|nr:serine/threonine-protein kinase RsbW [Fodinibius sediminis]